MLECEIEGERGCVWAINPTARTNGVNESLRLKVFRLEILSYK